MISIVAQRYAQALYHLTVEADDLQSGQTVQAFVRLLKKRQLLIKLEMIIDAFRQYAHGEDVKRRLTLTAARPLSQETQECLAAHEPRMRQATKIIDPNLIGGLIIKDGSTIIDGSVKRQCQELQRHLCK